MSISTQIRKIVKLPDEQLYEYFNTAPLKIIT